MSSTNTVISNPILNNEEEPTKEIGKTQWNIKHQCCCCGPYVEVIVPNDSPRHFLRHWEFHPAMPIFVSILVLFCLVDYFVVVAPYQYKAIQIIAPFPIIITLVLFLWSYWGAVCMDPGYLPFDWITTQKFYYSWEDQLSGLAVTSEQIKFGRENSNRPPHCSFSSTAGRYVIRADHICGWIANWVGKRNHKQFMLLCFWGGLFCGFLTGFNFGIKDGFFDRPMELLIPQLVGIAIEGPFCLVLLGMFATTVVDLAVNRTKIQRMRGEGGKHYSFKESVQEVCGTGNCCTWWWPTPAFDENMVITADMLPIGDDVDE